MFADVNRGNVHGNNSNNFSPSLQQRHEGQVFLLCELCLLLMLPVIWLVQAQQVMCWGAEGVIVGSALVKALGEAPTPEAGLQAMKALAQQLRDATRS